MTGAVRRLGAADRLLREPDLVDEVLWPRACTWRIRLELEHALDEHRAAVDADLGRRATELWHGLSRAAHHHADEPAPTAAELRARHDSTAGVVIGLNERR